MPHNILYTIMSAICVADNGITIEQFAYSGVNCHRRVLSRAIDTMVSRGMVRRSRGGRLHATAHGYNLWINGGNHENP